MLNRRRGFTLIELIVGIIISFVVLLILGMLLSIFVKPGRLVGGINSTYSQSTRIGTIIKFGEKTNFLGMYKSWEGAMQVSNFGLQSQNAANSTVNGNVWEFSLYNTADKALTDKILLALKEQRPISLTYNQWWSRPATIDTEYVVTSAEFPEEARAINDK